MTAHGEQPDIIHPDFKDACKDLQDPDFNILLTRLAARASGVPFKKLAQGYSGAQYQMDPVARAWLNGRAAARAARRRRRRALWGRLWPWLAVLGATVLFWFAVVRWLLAVFS